MIAFGAKQPCWTLAVAPSEQIRSEAAYIVTPQCKNALLGVFGQQPWLSQPEEACYELWSFTVMLTWL